MFGKAFLFAAKLAGEEAGGADVTLQVHCVRCGEERGRQNGGAPPFSFETVIIQKEGSNSSSSVLAAIECQLIALTYKPKQPTYSPLRCSS